MLYEIDVYLSAFTIYNFGADCNITIIIIFIGKTSMPLTKNTFLFIVNDKYYDKHFFMVLVDTSTYIFAKKILCYNVL